MSRNVLYVLHSLEAGGMERIVISMANRLSDDRFRGSICCIRRAGALADLVEHPERLYVLGREGRIDWGSLRKLAGIVRRNRIDIIHSHNTAGLMYGFPPARYCGVPLVHTMHGFERDLGRVSPLNLLEKWMSRRVSRFVCVSRQLQEDMKGFFGIRDDASCVVYNGIGVVDAPPRKPDRSLGIVMGSVGRLNAVKNYRLLLDAFHDLAERHPSCRLVIVGGGEEYDDLVARRDELSMRETVTFTGFVKDVHSHLRTFDMFVLTSVSEGHALSILEAMSHGIVCVVSDVGGNSEIITHGENGYLFRSGGRDELVSLLSFVIERLDTPAMDALRDNARETVRRRFSIEAMIEGYRAIYESLPPARRCRSGAGEG